MLQRAYRQAVVAYVGPNNWTKLCVTESKTKSKYDKNDKVVVIIINQVHWSCLKNCNEMFASR